MKKLMILILFLSACSSVSDSSGPSACERQLTLCKNDLIICQGLK